MRCINYRHLIVDKNTHETQNRDRISGTGTRLCKCCNFFILPEEGSTDNFNDSAQLRGKKADVNEDNSEDLLFY